MGADEELIFNKQIMNNLKLLLLVLLSLMSTLAFSEPLRKKLEIYDSAPDLDSEIRLDSTSAQGMNEIRDYLNEPQRKANGDLILAFYQSENMDQKLKQHLLEYIDKQIALTQELRNKPKEIARIKGWIDHLVMEFKVESYRHNDGYMELKLYNNFVSGRGSVRKPFVDRQNIRRDLNDMMAQTLEGIGQGLYKEIQIKELAHYVGDDVARCRDCSVWYTYDWNHNWNFNYGWRYWW